MARQWDAPDPLAFATAVVRDAPVQADTLRAIHSRTGLRLQVLPREVEARLKFLGARRWLGWCSGPLALFDMGGGSLEVAFGRGRTPEFAASQQLGANLLTDEFFDSTDPPPPSEVATLHRKVRHQMRDTSARIRWENPQTAVTTSRTLQQLARQSGAPPGRHGPFAQRVLRRRDLHHAIDRLAKLSAAERAELADISAPRARQSLARAIVGHSAMKLSGLKTLVICPWALREGVLLRYLEDGADWWADLERHDDIRRSLDATPVGSRPPQAGTRRT